MIGLGTIALGMKDLSPRTPVPWTARECVDYQTHPLCACSHMSSDGMFFSRGYLIEMTEIFPVPWLPRLLGGYRRKEQVHAVIVTQERFQHQHKVEAWHGTLLLPLLPGLRGA